MPDKYGNKIRLQHVLDAIETIETYIGDSGFALFQSNGMLQDACIRQLQVIGEACNHVSEALQNEHPEIAWGQIIGLRNIIIHQYVGVDEKVIWDILQFDLPSLRKHIEDFVSELPDADKRG